MKQSENGIVIWFFSYLICLPAISKPNRFGNENFPNVFKPLQKWGCQKGPLRDISPGAFSEFYGTENSIIKWIFLCDSILTFSLRTNNPESFELLLNYRRLSYLHKAKHAVQIPSGTVSTKEEIIFNLSEVSIPLLSP